jgi:putative mRNA 3-end processing factor
VGVDLIIPVSPLLEVDASGLHCAIGGFHVDPWRPVKAAVITHAHGDHARPGSDLYYCAAPGAGVLRRRLGPEARIEPVPFGERFVLGSATLSFHPAGHVLGSAQVRVEAEDVWVVSGDYKRQPDPSCEPFEPVACDTFITEATFALPIYRWGPTDSVITEIWTWWQENAQRDRASILFCYSLGKAQRILAELAGCTDRTMYLHGAVSPMDEAYRAAGVHLPPTARVSDADRARGRRERFAGELVIAPPSAAGTPWVRRFGAAKEFETGFASGWMRVRGIRRRRGYDRGFVISDHADWSDLLRTIRETGAKRVLATHGYSESLARYLREQGLEAGVLPAPYSPEDED